MPGTPNTDRVWIEVHEMEPEVDSMGVWNCRPIAGTSRWSEHAWGNAWDPTSPRGYGRKTAANLKHMMFLDEIANYLMRNKARLNIRNILWRRASHWNHIHVDFWPRGHGTPPCKGGTLQVKYRDGTIGSSWIDTIPEDDEQMIEQGATGNAVTLYQKALILWKNTALPNGGPDGIYGDETTLWVTKYQKAAGVEQTGIIDGVTAALLSRYVAKIPTDIPDSLARAAANRAINTAENAAARATELENKLRGVKNLL